MNASQIDPAISPSSARVVGYADGAELQAKLAEGFLCGAWSKKRRAYKVMRKPNKRGRRPRVSDEQIREVAELKETIHRSRARLCEIIAASGVTGSAIKKRLYYLTRKK